MLGHVSNDARAHCLMSCKVSKACGPGFASFLGNLKESRDLAMGGIEWALSSVLSKSSQEWLHDNLQGGTVEDSAKDFEANFYGLGVAKADADCLKECEARYGPEPVPQ